MNWRPIGYAAKAGLSITEFVAEMSVARVGMVAPMRIVEGYVQEERPEKELGVNTRVRRRGTSLSISRLAISQENK